MFEIKKTKIGSIFFLKLTLMVYHQGGYSVEYLKPNPHGGHGPKINK
jgi:hypothetical protein